VVASFYPLAEVARDVGGDRVEVLDLTPPGVEPHDLELSTDDVEALNQADIVLYLGGGFQPGVEKVVRRAEGDSVDVLGAVEPVGDDPHIWLDPLLMKRMVDVTQAALTRADPGQTSGYAERADVYRRRLDQLDAEYRAGLAQCQRQVMVTSHDAFGYLARRYGLEQEAISGLSPEAEPDPRRIAELADLVRRSGATTVFTESLVPPAVAETLAREAGVTTAVLDPVESLTDDQSAAGETYITAMMANLAELRRALGCT
jgi:zinc transport system substrate-binding protein